MTCPYCGAVEPERVERCGLVLLTRPYRLIWRGERIWSKKLTRLKYQILMKLLRYSETPHDLLQGLLREDTGPRQLYNHIYGIRKIFAEAGVPFVIRASRGIGYELLPANDISRRR